MKSNRHQTQSPPQATRLSSIHQTLSKEKEALVTMFLSSASHNELSEQIKKIDALCSKLDQKRGEPAAK